MSEVTLQEMIDFIRDQKFDFPNTEIELAKILLLFANRNKKSEIPDQDPKFRLLTDGEPVCIATDEVLVDGRW